jgi:hypothetical protein
MPSHLSTRLLTLHVTHFARRLLGDHNKAERFGRIFIISRHASIAGEILFTGLSDFVTESIIEKVSLRQSVREMCRSLPMRFVKVHHRK